MRIATGILLVTLLLVPETVAAQRPPQIKYYFLGEPGVAHVDDRGHAEAQFRIFAEFSGFACTLPLEIRFEVRLEPHNKTWAAADAQPPPKITVLPPGPWSGSSGQSTLGLFVASWDTDAAPLDGRHEYFVRAQPVPPDFSYCAPKPAIIAGYPDFWNVTVCREPQHGGLGAGCKELQPMDLAPPRRVPAADLSWLVFVGGLVALRRRG